MTVYTLDVPCTVPWTDTGINIAAGSQLDITATGIVAYGGSPSQVTDANGGDYTGQQFLSDMMLSNTVCHSLIGKIGGTIDIGTGTLVPEGTPGNGPGFVGTSYGELISTSGEIFLGFNDDPAGFWDNSGSFSVTISVVPSDPLQITPVTGFAASGGLGGPFTVTSQGFSLTNTGTSSLNWSLANTSLWLNVSLGGGSLTPGGPAATVTVSLNSTASNLVVGTYSATVWFTNLNDNVGQSRQFTLAVISTPLITAQPADQIVLEGATATFTVGATGGMPLFYQWQVDNGSYLTNLSDGSNISGSTSSTLTISNVSGTDEGAYSVVVSNVAGVVTSADAFLAIIPWRPVITEQPANQTVVGGQTAAFTVAAIGTTPFFYQWNFNGTNIAGATNTTLTLTNIQLTQTGSYAVEVSNALGSVLSSNATLSFYCPLLDINFGAPDINKVGFAAIGQTANDYWNGYQFGGQTFGTISDLKWADQNDSGINLTVLNAPGVWANDTGDGMYDPFIYPWDGGNITATFSNVPAGNYDFYLYGHSGVAWENTKFQITNGTNTTAWEQTQDSTFAATSTNWTEGVQYVVFRNVVISSGQSVVITCAPGDAGAAILNGLQMVSSDVTPYITVQPTNQMVVVGGTASFSVTATGTLPLS